jgi:hypothetical protein
MYKIMVIEYKSKQKCLKAYYVSIVFKSDKTTNVFKSPTTEESLKNALLLMVKIVYMRLHSNQG